MKKIKLIHWNAKESKELSYSIKIKNTTIDFDLSSGPELLKNLQSDPPDLFILSLNRLPSQGRDFAIMIRLKKSLRAVPIIFTGGDKVKVDKIKKLLPDAFYTDWENINIVIPQALQNAPKEPVVHSSVFAAYEKTPLIKKLGIISNSKLVVVNKPKNFLNTLGSLPQNVVVTNRLVKNSDLIIWFADYKTEVEKKIESISSKLSAKGKVWIAWRKKAAGTKTDLTQVVVRKIGLASGLVDYKICSIDKTWSALLFTPRER